MDPKNEKLKAIINGKLVTTESVIERGAVVIQGKTIIDCGPYDEVTIPEDAEIIDAEGLHIVPGFVDIHCHGGGGVLAYQHPYEFACAHLKFGTTAILPTLSYNESKEQMVTGVTDIVEVINSNRIYSEAIIGIHMEGPYINPKYGAITSPIRPVDPEEYAEILRIAGSHIKVWTLAPELEGQEGFVEAASQYGIALSVGHSEATAEQIYRFVAQGLRIGCHCTNASGTTPSPSRLGGTREFGVDEAVLLHDDIYAEVIPDAGGNHVRPNMLKLILKTKGIDRVIIISDAMDTPAGVRPGDADRAYAETEAEADGPDLSDVNFNEKGHLAGSLLTMDKAVRNMIRHTGIDIVKAFRLASLNPAAVIGMDHELGSIDKGKIANILLVTDKVEIRKVLLHGEVVNL
ncbi:N-acetylglucosamine-6-phosphate deacetylase [Paenibacillus eucommiae]|uniref:N-acetylglucosamine-6-phosphate deacetylase n=1 Tax=Paenibacillus eucommiae TaxID=1355755 RepID=A0ABS4J005_9BACL|nr:amidohydrolase family protein [Paenibacillus eucommiae]MBP1993141.1 N-acetylglucosamine-6-phosphate deacetylase [Paenibacillus eucommiae]